MDYWNVYQRGDYLMNKSSQAYNYHTLPKSPDDKKQRDEQAQKDLELRTEDDLFNRELSRLGYGALVWGGE